MNRQRGQDLAQAAVELMERLVDDIVDEQEGLEWLAERCVELFGVDAAGVLLIAPTGPPRAAAATTPAVRSLQQLAAASGEGPGPACCHTGTRVVVPDLLRALSPWPRYTRHACSVGARAVCSLPLRHRRSARTLGALNLFARSPETLGDAGLEAAQIIADTAALALVQRRVHAGLHRARGQLQHALDSRVLIEQAK
ncbi:GAF domain-containing protein [Streptomyces sp. AN091965]|uniref:GAF domain-containing protein n=1 Tax=Streptomyces sp. AN091965 TaxID=2927803 RepID=UPI001F61E353|nr:GAF domain-containing protein [Streptomyces sp. AN091965]MCI3927809.1 GAF domain-containing protein [Streptomyces sp. AN091965]